MKCGVKFRYKSIKKYCSICSTYGTLHKDIVCVICGEKFDRKHPCNKRNTCSSVCFSKLKSITQKGDKSHRWLGGRTTEAMIIRNSFEYKQWRTSVFERDKYTCKICGEVGGKLHADHIKRFSDHPELRLDINNGRTLCVTCHVRTDTWGAKRKKHHVQK